LSQRLSGILWKEFGDGKSRFAAKLEKPCVPMGSEVMSILFTGLIGGISCPPSWF
jgi:hypothetical protein